MKAWDYTFDLLDPRKPKWAEPRKWDRLAELDVPVTKGEDGYEWCERCDHTGVVFLGGKATRCPECKGVAYFPRKPRVLCADWLCATSTGRLTALLALIVETPHLNWVLVSKNLDSWQDRLHKTKFPAKTMQSGSFTDAWLNGWQPSNVTVGLEASTQKDVDTHVSGLLKIPSRVRLLVADPLLGPIDLGEIPYQGDVLYKLNPLLGRYAETRPDGSSTSFLHGLSSLGRLDGVVVAGERGPEARPMHPDWARSLRDQCKAAGASFFFRGWGAYRPKLVEVAGEPRPKSSNNDWGTLTHGGEWFATATPWNGLELDDSRDDRECLMIWTGAKAAGRALDGQTWDYIPA